MLNRRRVCRPGSAMTKSKHGERRPKLAVGLWARSPSFSRNWRRSSNHRPPWHLRPSRRPPPLPRLVPPAAASRCQPLLTRPTNPRSRFWIGLIARNSARLTSGRPGAPRPMNARLLRSSWLAFSRRSAAGIPPYVDFAIFKPHGSRQFKLNRFEAQVFINGELKTRALTGPPNFEAWQACWEVFRAACVSLEEVSPATLDSYAKGISMLNDLFPAQWGVVFCADEIMRAEIWNRLAEELEDKKAWPEHRPWDFVIKLSTYGGSSTSFDMLQWWQSHVLLPCQNQSSPLRFIQRLEGTELLPSPLGWTASSSHQAPRSNSAPPNKRRNRNNPNVRSDYRAGPLGASDQAHQQQQQPRYNNQAPKGGKGNGKGKGGMYGNDKGKGKGPKGPKGSQK